MIEGYESFPSLKFATMKIAVITPFYKTPIPWLEQCIASVQAQTVPCTHILVSDGDPSPMQPRGETMQLIQLPQPHADAGNVGRAIGSVSAISQGFDAIAYLDADNWYQPRHLESLVALHHATNAAICTCTCTLHHLDGSLLGVSGACDGVTHVDTSCFFITRPAFGITAIWYLMERQYGLAGDRVFWENIKAWHLSHAHTGLPTVAYRTGYRSSYLAFEVEPPEGTKENVQFPPPGSAGVPIWSPLSLQSYQPFQLPLPLQLGHDDDSEIVEDDLSLPLREINLIVFPDWLQPEDLLLPELTEVIRSLMAHPNKHQMTLLIDTTAISNEDADLALCQVLMNLLWQDHSTGQDDLEIALLDKLDSQQWEILRSDIHYQVPLQHQNHQLVADRQLTLAPKFLIPALEEPG